MTPEEQSKALKAGGVKSKPAKPAKKPTKIIVSKTQGSEASEPSDNPETLKRSRSNSQTTTDEKRGPLLSNDYDPRIPEYEGKYTRKTQPYLKPTGKKRVTAVYRISSDTLIMETSFK
jgi:hypothetical protein